MKKFTFRIFPYSHGPLSTVSLTFETKIKDVHGYSFQFKLINIGSWEIPSLEKSILSAQRSSLLVSIATSGSFGDISIHTW